MKKTTLTSLLLLTTVTLFTACSNKTVEPKKEVKALHNIIGLQETIRPFCPPTKTTKTTIASLPLAKTYPMEEASITPIVYEEGLTPIAYAEDMGTVTSSQSCRTYTSQQDNQQASQHNYISNSLQLKKQIEWNAKKLLGIKYVWGATGPNKYDCSGFTQKIYRDSGIKIPRVSRDQAKVGKYVSYSRLKKGDMVFFDTKKKRTGIVSHVGIYLGSGNFIHASSGAKKIVIYNFNKKSFYKKRFLWGRRVVQNSTHLASL
jgi:cell wall-associated NlpC family hydrolase